MTYSSNIQQVSDRLQKKINRVKDQQPLLRKIAVHLKSTNEVRVFTDGQKSTGAQIGTYSAPYLKRRIAGTSSKKRTRFTSDSKVILRNEGLLKEDLKVIALPGGWGVAFTSARSAELVPELEDRYGDDIWGISTKDEKDIDTFLTDELRDTFR